MSTSSNAPPEELDKKSFPYKFRKIRRKTPALEPSPQACNFIKKETLAQVFSWEFCKISKNTFSYRTPLVAASNFALHQVPHTHDLNDRVCFTLTT